MTIQKLLVERARVCTVNIFKIWVKTFRYEKNKLNSTTICRLPTSHACFIDTPDSLGILRKNIRLNRWFIDYPQPW